MDEDRVPGGGRRDSNPDLVAKSEALITLNSSARTSRELMVGKGVSKDSSLRLPVPPCPPGVPLWQTRRGCSCPGTGRRRFPVADHEALVVRLGRPASGSALRVSEALILSAVGFIPRMKTRAPGGPADRVERSSPALRSPGAPLRVSRVRGLPCQTGVPPPRTGQCEMKPCRASQSSHAGAGPSGVSSRICGCQGAGLSGRS